jgi:hypothetical protein
MLQQGTVGVAPGTATLYLPYPTVADMRGQLGLIDPNDSWRIDRKWGNPGTTTFTLTPRGPILNGAGFGLDPLQELAAVEVAKRDARAAKMWGIVGTVLGVVSVGLGIAALASRRRR